LYHYPEFSPATSGLKFSNELYHNMSRKHAWEAVFRIRLSHGFNQTASYGNMQVKAKTMDLVLCPTIDSDRVYAYEFEFGSGDGAKEVTGRVQRISKRFLFVQSALLYSTSEGERRIRCHSVAIPLTTSL
jgi:protein transport protein SEC24